MPSSYLALLSFNVRISINLPCVEYSQEYTCRAVSGHAGKQSRGNKYKKRETAIHPPDHKSHDRRENCRRERALLFSKQETSPDLKKEMLNKKRNTEEHNFRKILRKKSPFRSILPEDMQLKDVHNLWQEEKLLPPCHKLCLFKKKRGKKKEFNIIISHISALRSARSLF
jgi:hypothetical protein